MICFDPYINPRSTFTATDETQFYLANLLYKSARTPKLFFYWCVATFKVVHSIN